MEKEKVMSRQIEKETKPGCREVRQSFAGILKNQSEDAFKVHKLESFKLHLNGCKACAGEYQLFSLGRTALDLAASPEVIEPGKEFFVGLRARIARGNEVSATPRNNADESWSAALLITARQLMPALAMLLLVIIGATVLWQQPSVQDGNGEAQYKVRGLTTGDMLDSIVAEERIVAEEKANDK
jgi:hypothetical protein